MHHHVTLFIAT